jgi:hypothetical protein
MSDSSGSNQTNSDATPSGQPAPGVSDGAFDLLDTEGNPVKRVGVGLLLLFVLAGLVLLIVFFHFVRHWVAIHTGTVYSSSNPVYYNFWSGFGSDLGEATLIGAVSVGVYTFVRKANCHSKRCWRIGHFPLEGTPYHLCKRHHPGVPAKGVSQQHILEQHRKYLEAQTPEGSSTPSPS